MMRSLSVTIGIGTMIAVLSTMAAPSAEGQIMVRPGPIAPPPAAAPAAAKAGPSAPAADASNSLAYDLFAKLRSAGNDRSNLFFSPYSISSALTMTRLGARGQTADEMSTALHLPADVSAIESSFGALNSSLVGDPEKQGFSLSVANALWGQKGEPFLPDYLDVVKKDFDASLMPMDFITQTDPSRQQINDWVAHKTQDKIKDLLPPGSITPDTRLVLTNAIYFKGQWSSQFQANQTKKGDFRTDRKIQADFMNQTEHVPYAEDDLCQAVKLPYTGDRVYMLVLLPKVMPLAAAPVGEDAYHVAIGNLENSLSAQYVKKLTGQLADRKVILSLPKWHATESFSLGATLADMGMKLAFSPHADFSGINGRTDLFLSDVVHKAFVTVDENGTEAAAATAVLMRTLAMRLEPEPVKFNADHPFIYLIVDAPSHAILFAGRLSDPSAEE
jgi:serine protease inhibitor